MTRSHAHRELEQGFTIIELMVTITILAILMALAMPAMSAWVRNGQVRASADALQNGLRQAQAEAMRRSRQVVFLRSNTLATAADASAPDATASGKYWSLYTVGIGTDSGDTDTNQFVESGTLGTPGGNAVVGGPASLCFSSLGRLTPNTNPGSGGVACDASSRKEYDVTLDGADRPLRVLVDIGGQVHMCDPAKTLSSSNPDGCPAS